MSTGLDVLTAAIDRANAKASGPTRRVQLDIHDAIAIRNAVAELLAEQRRFREAFVIAVGDSSPFARGAIRRIDAAIARCGGAP